MQSWLAQVRRLAPDAGVTMIYLPRKPDAPVEIFATDRAAFHERTPAATFFSTPTRGRPARHAVYEEHARGEILPHGGFAAFRASTAAGPGA